MAMSFAAALLLAVSVASQSGVVATATASAIIAVIVRRSCSARYSRAARTTLAFRPFMTSEKMSVSSRVRFIPTDKSHNAETIPGMVPDGAEAFKGKLNQAISVTFETEGVYGYKCMPHYAIGMVGVVVVGDPVVVPGAGGVGESAPAAAD